MGPWELAALRSLAHLAFGRKSVAVYRCADPGCDAVTAVFVDRNNRCVCCPVCGDTELYDGPRLDVQL